MKVKTAFQGIRNFFPAFLFLYSSICLIYLLHFLNHIFLHFFPQCIHIQKHYWPCAQITKSEIAWQSNSGRSLENFENSMKDRISDALDWSLKSIRYKSNHILKTNYRVHSPFSDFSSTKQRKSLEQSIEVFNHLLINYIEVP